MCCFSRPVRHVSATKIFARSMPDGQEVLVYGMNVSLDEDLAMVLPLPVTPGSGDDAVSFIDLSGYPRFFDDLGKSFPEIYLPARKGGALSRLGGDRPTLPVHPVGEFEASYVPTVGDFDRLDPRFRLPSTVWSALPQVRDHGFAVFKLRRPRGLLSWFRRLRTVHPMAFSFPRRDPSTLFFPTLHVHDGEVHPRASFDHTLYCQPDPDLAILLDWERSAEPLGHSVDAAHAAGIVDPDAPGFRKTLMAEGPNEDVVISAAHLRATTVLGELFLLRDAGAHGPTARPAAGTSPWPMLPADAHRKLEDAIATQLRALTRDRRDDWGLARYRDDLPERWPTLVEAMGMGDTGSRRASRASRAPQKTPCRLKFYVWTERVAPHEVSLAFHDEPARDLRDQIQADLSGVLDEAAAASGVPSAGASSPG